MLKTLCAATLIALGTSAAHAERVIVRHDASQNGLKKGHQVLVEGNGWFAVDLDSNGKSAMRNQKGFKNIEVDHVRVPLAIYNDTDSIYQLVWRLDKFDNTNEIQFLRLRYNVLMNDGTVVIVQHL